ncbi:hypothetical protein EX30DRAFT_392478 [Ascodesmis nigricans]|uniref:Man1/Src1 C-terminal domain-containing protein n=1 Tax=Ascodesmis nigricans TaxID=341454 RepID=A0A4S2N781_9PEZI|nr:hypothetical protein EX30DRAFT_392478 [Ascodesmis nigricans]
MDDEYYLDPGFDPATLKVAELRGILLKHDIDYPSSAKKADLVEIFTRHLSSQASTIRAASSRVRPSARGMVNAGDPNVPEFITPQGKGRRSTSRRLTAAPPSDDEENDVGKQGRGRRTPVRKSATPVEFSRGSVRSTRRSSVLPQQQMMQAESVGDADAETDGTESTEGPFSSYNPFQGGNSPAAPIGRTPARSARKSLPAPGSTARRETSGSRRRTEIGLGIGAVDDDRSTRRRKSQQLATIPSQPYDDRVAVKQEEPEYDYTAGEEFVPEEAEELARLPQQELARREPRYHRGGNNNMGTLWLVFTFVALAYGIWWRNEKIEAGYCGVGGLGEDHEPQDALTSLLRPECEPCPPHARCYPGFTLECDNDYIQVNKWSSLGGLLPIPPDCLPDTEKERRKSIMSNAALEILRESGAEQRCKERFLRSDMPIEGVSEEDLRQVLYDRKAVLRHRPIDRESGRRKLKSTSLAALPLGCSIRFFITGSVAEHRGSITLVILSVLTFFYLRHTLTTRRAYNDQVTRLIHISLRQLSRHATEHPDQPYIAVAHLRDQVLRHEFNPKKRSKLWEGVEKVVELNSNVRAGEKEVQGEIMRVWTWIGGRYVEAAPERRMLEGVGEEAKPEGEVWQERIVA